MTSVLDTIDGWVGRGDRVALATVVETKLSAPQPAGTKMALNEGGAVVGAVSGGCVEGAVVTEALAVLSGEKQRRVVTFGYSDDEAFAVGLTCGGTIHLYVEPLDW